MSCFNYIFKCLNSNLCSLKSVTYQTHTSQKCTIKHVHPKSNPVFPASAQIKSQICLNKTFASFKSIFNKTGNWHKKCPQQTFFVIKVAWTNLKCHKSKVCFHRSVLNQFVFTTKMSRLKPKFHASHLAQNFFPQKCSKLNWCIQTKMSLYPKSQFPPYDFQIYLAFLT